MEKKLEDALRDALNLCVERKEDGLLRDLIDGLAAILKRSDLRPSSPKPSA